MKKKILFAILLVSCYLYSSAQSKNEVTILYLLPFHLESNLKTSFKSINEIHKAKQFEMMGFWLGTKIALREHKSSDKKINIVVRDVVTDENALQNILNDHELMKEVNIIVGPFYGSLFPVAAEYAKNNNILIVNPFTTRFDFVQNNPAVYKLIPPFYSRPEVVADVFLSKSNDYNIILWGDSVQNAETQAYKQFFTEQNIAFKEVQYLSASAIAKKKNLIIATFEKPARVIHSMHVFSGSANQDNNVLIMPESWLSISELTFDFFNMPHLYFFTNYFVDENSDAVQQFQLDYTLLYGGAPAELDAYSYQGYDVTHYFMDLFFADFDVDKMKFEPLCYKFQWEKITDGGYENKRARLIRLKEFEFEEVK
jgi:hypothetical protein